MLFNKGKKSQKKEEKNVSDFNTKKTQSFAEREKAKQSQKPNKRIRKVIKSEKELLPSQIKNYVQDFLPIVDISNGIIETKDGRFVKIIEVEPINFRLRDEEEQYNILTTFAGLFKMPQLIRFQFKSITKQADSRRYIDILMRKINEEDSMEVKSLANNYIELINALGNREAVTRRFFIIFEYSRPMALGDKRPTYTEIVQEMETVSSQIESILSVCGNSVIDYVSEGKDPNMQTLEILYSILNRRSSINEPVEERIDRLTKDYMDVQNLIPGVDSPPTIASQDIIAPRGIDFSSNNHVVYDGLYYTYLYIDGNGYPDMGTFAWVSELTGNANGIDLDIHFKKEPRTKILEEISRKTRQNKSKIKTTEQTSLDFEELQDSISSANFLKASIQSKQDFFYFGIIITISAPTYQMMMQKKRFIKDNLITSDILVNDITFDTEQAFLSTLPLNKVDKGLFKKARHNSTTYNVASLTYMFTAFEIGDEDGVLLGVNTTNSSLCVVDLFNSRIYKNANMVLIGTTGSGKTFTMQLLALRMRMMGIQVFILAPIKGEEFYRGASAIGGEHITISSDSSDAINVMEIRPKGESNLDILLDGYVENLSLLAEKLDKLSIFYKLIIKDLTQEEEALLLKATIKAYNDKGITHDNDSIYEIGYSQKTKKMPVLSDVYYNLKENESNGNRRIINILEQFVDGPLRNMNRQTNVDLSNKYIVLDISRISKDLKPVAMFVALDFCWDKIKEDNTKKKAIFIDETWTLINEDKLAAEYVLEIFKIIRGYGGSAIAATQDMGDFYALEDGKYGKGIVNNSKTKIILNLEQEEIDNISEPFRLSPQERYKIRNFKRGQALLSTNNNKVPIEIKASKAEEELITTDRAQNERLANRKRAQLAAGKESEEKSALDKLSNIWNMTPEEQAALFNPDS